MAMQQRRYEDEWIDGIIGTVDLLVVNNLSSVNVSDCVAPDQVRYSGDTKAANIECSPHKDATAPISRSRMQ